MDTDTIRLLIIDDYVSVRQALRVSLGKKPGLEVKAVNGDLQTAIDAVNGFAPDIVLFEPKSVNGKGYETCRSILEAPTRPAVIVHTSYRNEQEAMILAELGVCNYLLKDIGTQSLYEAILACHDARTGHESSMSDDDAVQ